MSGAGASTPYREGGIFRRAGCTPVMVNSSLLTETVVSALEDVPILNLVFLLKASRVSCSLFLLQDYDTFAIYVKKTDTFAKYDRFWEVYTAL